MSILNSIIPTNPIRPAHDLVGLHPDAAAKIDGTLSNSPSLHRLGTCGVGGNIRIEPVRRFDACNNDKVMQNGNAIMRLGSDRPAGKFSGKGGQAYTQCSAIDLCVGLGRVGERIQQVNILGNELPDANPNFETDAARVYITQNSDIDDYFEYMPKGDVGNVKDRSAVAAKADSIRLIAGEGGVKIVSTYGPKNSWGRNTYGFTGIDLITMDGGDLQPLVKGDNLVEALKRLEARLQEAFSAINTFAMYQNNINKFLATHTHPLTPGSVTTLGTMPAGVVGVSSVSPSLAQACAAGGFGIAANVMPQCAQNKIQATLDKFNSAEQWGDGNILSRTNNTT